MLKKVSKPKGKVSKESKAAGGKEMLEVRGCGKRIAVRKGKGKRARKGKGRTCHNNTCLGLSTCLMKPSSLMKLLLPHEV